MALRDYAEMAQIDPVSTTKSPTDRLSLLPKELLDMIYSFIFQSENGPWTIHIKQKSRDAGFSESDPDRILPILALPRDRKYKARRRENPDERWPDNIEEAFFRGMSNPTRHLLPSQALTAYTQVWTGHTITLRITITQQYPR